MELRKSADFHDELARCKPQFRPVIFFFLHFSQMTTRSNTPASPPHPGLQPGLKNAEYMKRWAPVSGLTPGLRENGHTGKSGYVTVLTNYPMANRH